MLITEIRDSCISLRNCKFPRVRRQWHNSWKQWLVFKYRSTRDCIMRQISQESKSKNQKSTTAISTTNTSEHTCHLRNTINTRIVHNWSMCMYLQNEANPRPAKQHLSINLSNIEYILLSWWFSNHHFTKYPMIDLLRRLPANQRAGFTKLQKTELPRNVTFAVVLIGKLYYSHLFYYFLRLIYFLQKYIFLSRSGSCTIRIS